MAHPTMVLNISILWILVSPIIVGADEGASQAGQQLQCYACGLPKVHPEYDVVGSYGQKIYNHSCEDMLATMKDGVISEKFIRTCPVGVKSCFGASGFYDHEDSDPSNDIWIRFLGCSEAKYMHEYGCDRELQTITVKDKVEKQTQVEIEVNLCFCSQHLCNHPKGELMTAKASVERSMSTLLALALALSTLG